MIEKRPNELLAKKLPESEEALTDKRRGREGRGEWEIDDLWEEVNAEREEEQEIDGIETKGEMHKEEVFAIREKRTEIPCRGRERNEIIELERKESKRTGRLERWKTTNKLKYWRKEKKN